MSTAASSQLSDQTPRSPASASQDGWDALVGFFAGGAADEVDGSATVEELAKASDLVVLARFVSEAGVASNTAPPDDGGADKQSVPTTGFTVEVVKGSPQLSPGERLIVSAFGVVSTNEEAQSADAALLFLHKRLDTGQYRLVNSNAVLVDRGGIARHPAALTAQFDGSALPEEGLRFAEVLSRAASQREASSG